MKRGSFKFAQTNPGSVKKASIQVTEFDVTNKPVLLVIPYGMQMNLPSYALMALKGHFECQEDNQFCFVTDPVNRDTTLDTGEIALGIPGIKTRIKFMKNGDIHFINGSTDGGDWLTKYTEMKAAFDQLKTDFNNLVTAYNSHQHTYVPGTLASVSTTGVQSGVSSSASMSNAKCAVIQIPNL